MTPVLSLLDMSRRLICDPCSITAGFVKEAHMCPCSSPAGYVKEAYMLPLFSHCWIRQGGSYVTPVLALLDTSRRLLCYPL